MPRLDPDEVQDVVAVLIGRVGDLIVAAPLLRALKQGYPRARVKLVVSNLCVETARLIPFIDHFEVMHRLHWIGRILPTATGLFFNPCDLAVDLNPSFSRTSTLLMTLLHGARVRLGFKKGRWDKVFNEQIDAPGEREHMLDRYARLAAALGIPYAPRLELRLRSEDHDEARRILSRFPQKKGRRILVHPGNFKKFDNRWPEEKLVELTDRLLGDPSLEVFYLAGPGEAESIVRIVAKLKRPVPIIPSSPLGIAGAIMKTMDLCFMNITGTTHLAGALDVPTFGLYSGYTDAVWRLRGPRHFGAVCRDWESCRAITVDEAYEGLKKALSAAANI